jgi:hypothetical protein
MPDRPVGCICWLGGAKLFQDGRLQFVTLLIEHEYGVDLPGPDSGISISGLQDSNGVQACGYHRSGEGLGRAAAHQPLVTRLRSFGEACQSRPRVHSESAMNSAVMLRRKVVAAPSDTQRGIGPKDAVRGAQAVASNSTRK